MKKFLFVVILLITNMAFAKNININIEKTLVLEKEYEQIIQTLCKEYDFEVNLVKAIIRVESGFDKMAGFPNGKSFGLMQLTKGTAKRFGVKDIYNPYENIHGGLKYLSYLRKLFNNDLKKMLAGYNLGENKVRKFIPPQGLHYIDLIMHCKLKYDLRGTK